MCGISGVFYADGRKGFAESWIDSAIAHQHHRGPDHNGKFVSEYTNLILGHNRLSIIDLSSIGNQPMFNQEHVMVFNGEIYNHKVLSEFSLVNDDFAKMQEYGDTKNLMKYISKVGIKEALHRANGMYALALYPKYKNLIVLAVDATAQKPLYYYKTEDEFYFASSPATLYNLKDKWEIDYDALETYWHLGAVIGENQIMKGIKKLTADQILIYDHQTKTIEISNLNTITRTNCLVEVMPHVINNAIDYVKESDVPVSLFLSGGIDSTIVASRFANTNTTAIHLNSPESQYARYVADKFKLNLHIVDPKNYSMHEIMTDYVTKSGEPTMAGPIPWIVAKEAKEFGKVAIIANGADELFFGYNRLRGDNQEVSKEQNNHLFRGSVFKHEKFKSYRHKFDDKYSSRMTDLMNFVQYDINRSLDFASMCHSLEMRSPFLTTSVINSALSIPESSHLEEGSKTILKRMLWNLGFTKEFTNRPKEGFSLRYKPSDTESLKDIAYKWCIDNGYLKMDSPNAISERDKSYLRSSALGFYYFYQNFKHKIK